MDTSALAKAYRDFHVAASRGPFNRPSGPGAWSAELVIAHVIASDRLLGASITQLLEGWVAEYDNRVAISLQHLQAIVGSHEDWGHLAGAAQRSGAEVVALSAQVDEETAARPFHVLVRDGDAIRLDQALTLERLIGSQVRAHLPAHTADLLGMAQC
jgi:hypothetical protein